jgi:hypothetical protein
MGESDDEQKEGRARSKRGMSSLKKRDELAQKEGRARYTLQICKTKTTI